MTGASISFAAAATVSAALTLGAASPSVPSDTWAPTASLPSARAGVASALLYDGRVLVTGGVEASGAATATTASYSPAAQAFLAGPSMATARANHTATLLADGRVLVAGGVGADGRATSAAETYDPATNTWTPAAPMYHARSGHTATALYDGRVVIAGGDDGGISLDSIEIYDPNTDVFAMSAVPLSAARTGHATTQLYDGTLLVIGGFDGTNELSSVDVYNPFFDTLTAGPALAAARAGHSATTLLSGKVLVAGGAGSANELASAEVYDPASRTFRAAGNLMVGARQRHQAFLLPHNNQVLIVGGTAGGQAVSTTEVYVEWAGGAGMFYQTSAPGAARAWATGSALSFRAELTIRSGPTDGLLLLAGGSPTSSVANPMKSSELYGFATVKTDKADYAPGMTATVAGGGWVPGETVTLTLQESPDFIAQPPLTAVADQDGNIVNTDFTADSSDINQRFYLTARGSVSEARTMFTDSLSAISATLDGGASVTLAPSGTTTANVTVTALSTNWHSTGWRIATSSGAFTCQNTADHNIDGTFSEAFAITAPSSAGTYNAYFAAYSDAACTASASPTLTLTNAVVVNTAAPTVTGVTSSATDGTYGVGSVVPIQITFNKPVAVTGTPQLTVETGATDAVVNYSSGTGTATLTFNYTVAASQSNADLDYVSTAALALNTGTIKDTAGTSAMLTLPAPGAAGSLGANKNLVLDTTAPTVTNVTSSTANGTYGTGAVIPIQVTFTEVVNVTGTPKLTLETGASDTVVNYSSGSGTATLTFNYTVPGNDANADLDYKATTSLSGGTIKDAAGNSAVLTLPAPGAAGSLGANKNIVIDAVGATVTDVTSSAANGTYTIGAVVSIQVIFEDTVTVTGTPQLTLETGTTNEVIGYVSGSGTSTLTFAYIVVAGDGSADLNYSATSSLKLNGGTITDSLNNVADLTLPTKAGSHSLAGNKDIVIDTTAPTVTNVTSSTANGTYGAGAAISIQLTFSEAVIVTGTPQLTLATGASNAVVNYASGSGTTVLTFTYTVAAAHSSADLNYASTAALALNGGTIKDAAANSATLTLPSLAGGNSLAGNKAIVIDAVAPAVTNVTSSTANGTYAAGAVISLQVTFSKTVAVTGTPQLTLETGTTDAVISYASGTGTPSLTFTYTVAAGHMSADLDYQSASALALNGGTITDTVASSPNVAVLTLPSPGSAGSLGANKDLVVDTTAPTVTNVTSSTADGSYGAGSIVSIQVTFSEAVTVTGTPRLTLETGASDAVVNYASGSGTAILTFSYTVAAGHTSADLDYQSASALALNGGTIRDAATNSATLTLAAPGAAGSLGANKNLVVDTAAPTVSSISRAAASPTNVSSVSWLVTFSESVTGVNAADFALAASGLAGSPAITGVTGSGGTFTVTATTGTGSGTLGLNLVDDDSIVDGAGNTLGGASAGNGNLTGAVYTIDRTLTPHVTAAGKAYDGTAAATILTLTLTGNVVSGDDVSLAGGTAAFDSKNVGSGKTVTATGLNLIGADATKYVLGTTSATTTANVTAVTLTVTGITASSRVYDRTTTATLNVGSAALVGVVSGDTVTLSTGSATGAFATAIVGTSKPVTIAGLTLGGADAGNYTLTQPTTTADITGKGLTVTGITASSKVYDRTTTATLSVGSPALLGVLSGDTVTVSTGSVVGSFATAAVGTNKTVTVAGLTLGGADAGNYTLMQPTTTADITGKTLAVIGITASSKVYDRTTSATLSVGSTALVGIVSGDTVTVSTGSAMAAFASAAVGTSKPVTVAGLTLGGADAGNYTLTQPTTTADITGKGLTVTGITASSKTYDQTTSATLSVGSAALVGIVVGDTVTVSTGSATGAFATGTVGTSKPVTVAGLTLGGADAGNYILTQPMTTADIIGKTLTVTGITASSKMYDRTTSATLSVGSAALVGIVSGDTVTLSTGSATGAFATAIVGTSKPVTIAGLTLGGADAGNYTLTQPTTTADITGKGLTVTGITASSKTYDQTTSATLSVGSAALVGIVGGDTVTVSTGSATGAFASAAVGTNKAVTVAGLTLGGADAGNYTLTQPTTTADITGKTLTVTGITAVSKVYDRTTRATLNVGSAALVGVVSGDTVALSTGATTGAFGTATVATSKPVTVAGLMLGGADAGNYTLTQPTTTADITGKGLTVTGIIASSKVYDGTTPAMFNVNGATLVGIAPGDAVTLNAAGATAAFASSVVGTNKTVTIMGLTLGGADAGGYVLATPTVAADITAAALVVTAANQSRTYGAASLPLTATYSGFVNAETAAVLTAAPTLTTSATISSHPGTYSIAVSGAAAANYTITDVSGTLTVTPAPIVATAADASRVAGDNNPTFTGTVVGVQNGDQISAAFVTPATASSAPGTYVISPVLVDTNGRLANYVVTLVNGMLTVSAVTAAQTTTTTPSTPETTPASTAPASSGVVTAVETAGAAAALPRALTAAVTGMPSAMVQMATPSSSPSGTTAIPQTQDTVPAVAPASDTTGSPTPADEDKLTGTSLAVTEAKATFGQTSVTLTAIVTPITGLRDVVNEGFVAFVVRSGTDLVSTVISGQVSHGTAKATVALNGTPAGTYAIHAVYESAEVNPTFASSTAAGTLTVAKATTGTTVTSFFNPSDRGEEVTLTAVVAPQIGGAPTGLLRFLNDTDGNPIATATLRLVDGQSVATFTTTDLPLLLDTITAVYVGDGNFKGSAGVVSAQGGKPAKFADATR